MGADTVVTCNDVIHGKPEDADDAVRILKLLSGQTHIVYSGEIKNIFLKWQSCHSYAETLFFTKISYHSNVRLPVYLPIFYFSFCQKTNLHLIKRARLSLFLFSDDLVSK